MIMAINDETIKAIAIKQDLYYIKIQQFIAGTAEHQHFVQDLVSHFG